MEERRTKHKEQKKQCPGKVWLVGAGPGICRRAADDRHQPDYRYPGHRLHRGGGYQPDEKAAGGGAACGVKARTQNTPPAEVCLGGEYSMETLEVSPGRTNNERKAIV